MEQITSNTPETGGAVALAPPYPQKTYVDGPTLMAWLWDTFNIKADRSKLSDLRQEGMPKRVYSPRCIRYNLEAVAAWFERKSQAENIEELRQRAVREASLQARQGRTVNHG